MKAAQVKEWAEVAKVVGEAADVWTKVGLRIGLGVGGIGFAGLATEIATKLVA